METPEKYVKSVQNKQLRYQNDINGFEYIQSYQ